MGTLYNLSPYPRYNLKHVQNAHKKHSTVFWYGIQDLFHCLQGITKRLGVTFTIEIHLFQRDTFVSHKYADFECTELNVNLKYSSEQTILFRYVTVSNIRTATLCQSDRFTFSSVKMEIISSGAVCNKPASVSDNRETSDAFVLTKTYLVLQDQAQAARFARFRHHFPGERELQ